MAKSQTFDLLENGLLRGREMSSLLVHVLSLLTLLFPYYSLFFLFVFPLYFSLLSISLFVSMFLAVLPYCFFTVHG